MPDETDTLAHPRRTNTLTGHNAAEEALASAWASDQMPHAWLITGPEGIGKATLAYRFARFVLKGEGGDLFGGASGGLAVAPDDPVSRTVAEGTHPDMFVLERTIDDKKNRIRNEIIIEDTRRASAFFAHTASAGGWRVVIVDAADELNRNAANALLKLVEEPPTRGLVLLVAHRPGRVITTLRSRCRQLRLRALPEDQVRHVLSDCVPNLQEGEAADLAVLAEGSPGRALRLASTDGLSMHTDLVAMFKELPAMDVEAQHRFADRIARKGAEERYQVLGELVSGLLARLIQTGAGHPPSPSASVGETEVIARLLPRRSLDQWVGLWENVTVALAKGQGFNLDRKQVVLNLFSTLQGAIR